jgi:hypothetical protein
LLTAISARRSPGPNPGSKGDARRSRRGAWKSGSSPTNGTGRPELHFTAGPLEGLKLVGFGVWERRGGGRNVTFPARQYSVNGERRSFALLRPITDITAQDRLRDLVLEAYAAYEQRLNVSS